MARRQYNALLMLLGNNSPKFWEWEQFTKIFNCLDPLVQKTKKPHTCEILQNERGRVINPRPLLWNSKNMEKWTHLSPSTMDRSQEWNFSSFNLSCPSETKCIENGIRPDFFFELNRFKHPKSQDSLISQQIHVAIAEDLLVNLAELVTTTFDDLVALTNPMFVAKLKTGWQSRTDCNFNAPYYRQFFKKDWTGDTEPNLDIFEMEGALFQVVKSKKYDKEIDGLLTSKGYSSLT